MPSTLLRDGGATKLDELFAFIIVTSPASYGPKTSYEKTTSPRFKKVRYGNLHCSKLGKRIKPPMIMLLSFNERKLEGSREWQGVHGLASTALAGSQGSGRVASVVLTRVITHTLAGTVSGRKYLVSRGLDLRTRGRCLGSRVLGLLSTALAQSRAGAGVASDWSRVAWTRALVDNKSGRKCSLIHWSLRSSLVHSQIGVGVATV
ncbi:1-(5-phosphoribosyl)-5-[(5-phosphoribosylamino) methylideneamino] imidazole-4-carboxamide isomerase [Striga asiatica]|uniref:1-(5-phosphoribosyl)-5-[(5-phosphoribosylamino) methylideneamino] imidazole-4-carboxamide isomerase n=1 Tax=Striga asiatica TaxID=4170 RepID=A0A5A7P6T0_STRAF|nr:1-(5-phosphoribosyl)-5-[(5-phosphoribosylamino) methylideneamino] imidazole-4-carboxamide isomerase [Striga asiatica]